MSTGSIRLHRVFRAKPEHLYRAFIDADAMIKWIPPCGFTCRVHHTDAKVGDTYRCRSRTSGQGTATRLAASILSACPPEESAIRTSSTMLTCPER